VPSRSNGCLVCTTCPNPAFAAIRPFRLVNIADSTTLKYVHFLFVRVKGPQAKRYTMGLLVDFRTSASKIGDRPLPHGCRLGSSRP